jgi:hypothetical protein
MVVYKHAELPIVNGQRPKLPSVFVAGPGALLLSFGSSGDALTQLSDDHGSLLAGGQLAPRSSWPKGIAPAPDFTSQPHALQMVAGDPRSAGPLTATVKRAAGGGTMNMNLPGLQADLEAGASAGQIDHVSVDPHKDAIGYRTSASRTFLAGTLLSAPAAASAQAAAAMRKGSHLGALARAADAGALSDRLVQFRTTSGRDGGEQLSFPSARELVLQHSGAPAMLTLTLSAFAVDGQPVAVRLPTLRLAAGETLRVAPANWRSLGSSRVRVSATVNGHTTRRLLGGHAIGRRFATVRRAALGSRGRHHYDIDLYLAIHHAPRDAWLSAAATLLRHGHAIAQAAPIQLSAAALSRGAVRMRLPQPLAPGRYTLKLRLLETTVSGAVQGSAVSTRTLAVRAR